jgi:hypothetical protein
MNPSITSFVVVAIVLAGPIAARAQSLQDGNAYAKARSVHHATRHHRTRTKDQSEYVADTSDTGGIPRLPSVFKNCEEPLPWYCAKPTGSLWFGSLATLQRHRRAAWVGPAYFRQW